MRHLRGAVLVAVVQPVEGIEEHEDGTAGGQVLAQPHDRRAVIETDPLAVEHLEVRLVNAEFARLLPKPERDRCGTNADRFSRTSAEDAVSSGASVGTLTIAGCLRDCGSSKVAITCSTSAAVKSKPAESTIRRSI
jgi:hypothetical protein